MSMALHHHLVEVASGAWSFDREAGAARRQLCVGFVDLVGYTALTQSSTTRTMMDVITRFENLVGAELGRGGGRLVKLIGDAAMFIVDEPERACGIALDMVETFEADPSVPPIRVAVAYGTVVASNGDYYGDVVNVAARLVAVAEPGSAVATAEAVNGAGDTVGAEQLPARALKGFPEPVPVFPARPPLDVQSAAVNGARSAACAACTTGRIASRQVSPAGPRT
ncbi:MAG: adenylate/guanylate cyclase domain-containing protein, partial [Acidimicrobiia bacterium]|nr:adenylate/guanylate cyclase domain-containing protein [Acidimicrobiia bacterium]